LCSVVEKSKIHTAAFGFEETRKKLGLKLKCFLLGIYQSLPNCWNHQRPTSTLTITAAVIESRSNEVLTIGENRNWWGRDPYYRSERTLKPLWILNLALVRGAR
jgi:hypothetical protein